MFLLDTRSNDVRMIGICGMGGLGKTTMARVVLDLISSEFEGSSFLADVREISEKGGLLSLQKQLLSDLLMLTNSKIWNVYEGVNMIGSRLRQKKVLLVVDDVVDIKQLESLSGKHDWFGSGSRIIITSRDKHLLMTYGVDEIYNLAGLNLDEALRLFCMKAFKTHKPWKGYEHLSKRVVVYAGGLPLALKVLGSFLFSRTVEEWESALERLKGDLINEILKILQISFDGQQEEEKKIFLDIACFFKGKDKNYVTQILEGCGFHPQIGISVLVEKSLISIKDNLLWMHDLLQEMGHQIVKRQCVEEPGKRSRLWNKEDVHHLLTKNTGTEVIEGIMVNYWEDKTYSSANAKSFLKMTNLRLLKIHNVQLPEGLEYLSNELRLLEWHGYPLESLPTNFQLDKIVELSMCSSNIKQMFNTIKPLNNLKFMRFSHSQNLTRTPNFTGVPNLEKLILIGCTRLQEIHQSLLVHKKLKVLNLKDCTRLITLPSKIHMGSLKKLILSGCSKLRKFPEIVESMECLSELLLDGTSIKELPLSVELLSGLVLLDLKDCKNLLSLPTSIITGLKRLRTLNLSGCWRLRKFPEIEKRMECLSKLCLDGTAIEELPLSTELLSGLTFLDLNDCKSFVRLPNTINGLKTLKTLNLSGCSKLENVPENLGEVESLEELDISGTAIKKPVSSIFLLKNLKSLSFHGCKASPASTSWFSLFPINLMPRRSSDPMGLVLPSLSGLSSLTKLDLGDCNLLDGAIHNICTLMSLAELNLSKNNFVSLPGTISRLSKLRLLMLEDCKRLQSLIDLPSDIKVVTVEGCASLERVSDALKSCNSKLVRFYSMHCLKLIGNNNLAFSMLKGFLEGESNLHDKFDTVVPGSKIPEWFKYQNDGSTITIITPPDTYYKNKFVGYAICSVFHVRKHPPAAGRLFLKYTHILNCHLKTDKIESSSSHFIPFDDKLGHPVSDHLWLIYQPLKKNSEWNFESNQIELSFGPSFYSGPGLEVKRCAVHPIYVDEGEEFNNTTKEWRRSKVWKINETDDQVHIGSTTDVATMAKRSLTEHAEAGAIDEDPQPKRLKQFE